jgi:hypothetical protein
MLRFTSCLISTVVAHAYNRRAEAYHHIFLAVTVLSVLFHCTHLPWARTADKCVAHVAFLAVMLDSGVAWVSGHAWLLLFPSAVALLWFGQSLAPQHSERLHVLLHFASISGLHCYLYCLY